MIWRPDANQAFNMYVDSDFSGSWNKKTAQDDEMTSKSWTGYIITYADCSVLWGSRVQFCVSLSSCESKYVAVSTTLHKAIVVVQFLTELHERNIADITCQPDVYCKVFEDNLGALELAR
eukprot:2295279-Ditylum_brightwellii.AAC.1